MPQKCHRELAHQERLPDASGHYHPRSDVGQTTARGELGAPPPPWRFRGDYPPMPEGCMNASDGGSTQAFVFSILGGPRNQWQIEDLPPDGSLSGQATGGSPMDNSPVPALTSILRRVSDHTDEPY